jgi:hypothetical protein
MSSEHEPEVQRTASKRKRYNVKWTASYRVPDELWALWEPLIPKQVNTHPFGGGRPRVPDRQCADGIYFVLRTDCQWKALDETGVCSGSVAHQPSGKVFRIGSKCLADSIFSGRRSPG